MCHEPENERGGGRASTLFWLAVLAAVIYAGVKAGPAYFANFKFQDVLQDVCRTPPSRDTEALVRDRLQKAIREHGLDEYMPLGACQISSSETSRTISCVYEREVQYLPGFRRTVRFAPKATAPLF